ncbi:hypothetical protein HQ325_02270 [Rhodococcus sp. BP-349]|nr:hypothetical protein [Rhodococcus sp. BP-363]MBY6541824.1 hypothetical protein [Rhodococcus sp. BP-369]MBY6561054.1 hypothetical protein [Rhodococcus sp. BP-370]MBY6575346.1 hypothetical protein [Rhodococcus sp. BP-364]MBY6584647.1 hypothetical protein [Rhodococcus sp. BP-358]MBY6588984.1 hypothetical protein [Rhodococcus sp. BP-362]MBY6594483.1 hypothetical protein [Rhodococcus sp. BP-359]MBY6597660.1 hypothetical protein [Rhodococcus sp. BP-353]MBY6603160.1 hypothetical protein [Rhodoc
MGRRVAVALAAVGLALAGCSQSEPETEVTLEQDSSVSAPATSVAASDIPRITPTTTLDVAIAGGEVTPVDQRLEGRAGEEILVTVSSDAEDEIHVHSVPEHSFPVAVGDDQQFRFTVDVPGSVDIELHEADVTVATVLVRS